ncbi:MAG: hypothetical protein QOK16_3736 [Solirubrobacteraceae bacterium]|jgi:hypothetical protein|nr:hypothetical protein [Solirubrobacteraceae bacterium]MEA2188725.1 hypothetical protein [Solirubrobacteraceae bacterium]
MNAIGGADYGWMKPSPHNPIVACLAVLVTYAVVSTSSAQGATQVESLVAATPAAAYDGTAMWSRLDAATGKYQLVQSVDGGAPTPVAVAQRDGAFDVDLGSSRSGSTYAVYSRDGDIYRLNPRSAVEQRLAHLSAPDRAERNPTIQGGRIAFVRRDGGMDQLRIGTATVTSRAKGTRLLLRRTHIQGVELGSKHVAWVDSVMGRVSGRQRVHVRNVATGKERLVYQAGGGGASFTEVSKPSFSADGSSFLWAVARQGVTGSRIVKYTLGTGELSYARGTPRYASVAWVNDELGAIVSTSLVADPNGGAGDCLDAGVQYCSIQYTGPTSFDLKP